MRSRNADPVGLSEWAIRWRALVAAGLVGVVVALSAAFAVFGVWQEDRRTARVQLQGSLIRLARAAASVVDTDLHRRLNDPAQLDSPDYRRAVAPLRAMLASVPDVRFIYTMVQDGDRVRFVLDASEPGDADGDSVEDRAGLWEVYDDPAPSMLEAFGDGLLPGAAVCSGEPYTDKWGTFVSAHAPLIAPSGEQIGIVGVDVNAAQYAAGIERAERRAIIGAIPAGLICVAGMVATFVFRARALQDRARVELSERRFRAIVEGSDAIVWEFDPAANRFTYVSPRVSILGHPLGRWQQPGFWQSQIHPDERDGVLAFCAAQTQAGQNHRMQYRLRRADGSYVWIDDVVSVDGSSPGRTMLRGLFIDISERKRVEQELINARHAAEAADRAKSEFLANMSHEIRTPLTAILGFAELAADQASGDRAVEARQQAMTTIQSAGQHLLSVINDILDLSKMQAGKLTVERVETHLPALLGEVESLVRPRAASKGVDLRVFAATPVPDRILTDPVRVRQILLNLAGNAAKFTERGRIEVSVAVTDGATPRTLIVEVADTGPGLNKEQAELLFQPFSQADTSVTRRHGGTGLGLSISRRLAGLLGGRLTLAWTAPGEGCRFRLEIPLEPAPTSRLTKDLLADPGPPTAPAPATQALPRLHGRILLAEDGVDNQRLIAHFLRLAGATVVIADHGRIALDALERAHAGLDEPIDLLLTDMQMPEMDGYSLASTVRARGWSIPVVALTAHAMGEDRDRCLRAGCDDYTTKPIKRAELLAMCARWIARAAPARPIAA